MAYGDWRCGRTDPRMAYHTMATGDAELRTLQAEVRTLAWRMTTGDADVRTLAWRMATGDADVRTLQAEVRTLAWRMTSGDADVRTLQAEVRTLAWRMAYGDEELRTLQAEVRTFQPGMRTFHWMTRYADDLQGHRRIKPGSQYDARTSVVLRCIKHQIVNMFLHLGARLVNTGHNAGVEIISTLASIYISASVNIAT